MLAISNTRKDIEENHIQDIKKYIDEHMAFADMAKIFDCNIKTIIRISHKIDPNYHGNQGNSRKHMISKHNVQDYLCLNGPNIPSSRLHKWLLDDGIKKHICEKCGLSTWLGKPIPIELHHINGNRFNNRIENIKMLCPNCHAFTPNYRGKNIKKY
jgi:5-methylcytosine-specific restriction endonuclease McrA